MSPSAAPSRRTVLRLLGAGAALAGAGALGALAVHPLDPDAQRGVLARLGGQARVHYFNQDPLSPQLMLRHRGVLDGLRTGGPGIRVVSDRSADESEGSVNGGFQTMNAVIQDHPDINVVMGSDTTVVGAYHALAQAGKLRDDSWLSGVDGDTNSLALIKAGTPYRASYAFSWTLMGYTMGSFAADWIEGRSIPRAVVALVSQLDSAAAVAAYEADEADPAAVLADPARYGRHFELRGNVSHAERVCWQREYDP